jgi:hypothetical protein
MSDVNADIGQFGGDEGQQHGNPAIEAEARSQGWVPQDEWQGNPSDWRDADAFVEKGKQVTAIMRKKLAGKDREIEDLKRMVEAQGTTVGELRDYIAGVEQKAYDRAVANLKAQRKDALANGDFAGAADVEEQIDLLKEAKAGVPEVKKPAKVEQQQEQQIHPDVARWMQSNPWFNEQNGEAVDYANARAARLLAQYKAQGVEKAPLEILQEVSVAVGTRFPELFDTPPAMFDSSSAGGRGQAGAPKGGKGRGFNSLPADAKAQFQRFYDQGFYTKKGDKNTKLDLAAAQAEYFANYQ